MALGLWVGALAIYLLLPAIAGRAAGPGRLRASLAASLAAGALGMIQALLMVGAVRAVVGTDVADLPALLAIAALASLTFVAVTQALVALAGSRGWFVALLLVALQLTSAGWPYPVETAPIPFQVLHPLLPLTYAVDAFRSAITGGGSIGIPAVVLAGWLVVALLVTLAVAARHGGARRAGVAAAPSAA